MGVSVLEGKKLDALIEAVKGLPSNANNKNSLDATFGAMLDGTNTTEIFWKWWALSANGNDNRYERLSRFARMLAQAWKDKVYTLRSYHYTVSGETAMTPLADLAGKSAAQLCTEETTPVEDWADEDPMTWYIRANALSLQDGTMNILALEGENGFDITGEVAPVYTFALALWVNEYTDGQYDYTTFATVQKSGLYPMPGDVGLDNKKRDLTWHSTFPGGLNGQGALTSGAGREPYNFVGATTGLTAARKMTAYEGLWNDCDTKWLLLMWQLRHFDLENSNILNGCQSYNVQKNAALFEENTYRFLVASGQASAFVVGSNVAIGDMSGQTSNDRGSAWVRSIKANVKIGSITQVTIDGTQYDAINLVMDEPINVPATGLISTMPYWSGDTEALPGHKDGARVSLTAGKTPMRVAGVEVMDGAYTIGLDPLYNVTKDAESGNWLYTVHECRDSEKLSGSITANYVEAAGIGNANPWASGWSYVKAFVRTKLGILFPKELGGASNTFYKSGFICAGSAGVRCPWRFGDLSADGSAGLACEYGYNTPSNAIWSSRPRLSGSGKKRGEWGAAA